MIKYMRIMLYVEHLKGLGIFKLKNNRDKVVVQSLISNPLHILWKKDAFYSKYFQGGIRTEVDHYGEGVSFEFLIIHSWGKNGCVLH